MSKEAVILIVDDEKDHADGIAEALEEISARSIAVYNCEDAIETLRQRHVDVVITDLRLSGDVDGLKILKEAKRQNADTEVILITAYASIETCKDAIRQGAYDYVAKPIDIAQLRTLAKQAGRKVVAAGRQHGQTSPSAKLKRFEFDGVRGKSQQMQSIFEVLRRVAPTDISVLIEGQSGTGKELLARAIHKNSSRADKPFRPVNYAGLTESLLESELFGHTKGAFTGATSERKGLFEVVDKGTLFLDEIGDMPLSMQAKLLRVIEDGVVTPVGSHKSTVVDVRFISATNHDIAGLVDEKKFRQDLYFRIKGVSVSMPALRDRPQDMAVLAEYFLKQAAEQTGSKAKGITESAMNVMSSYDWPGNIRQLRNCIRTMVVLSDREMLDVDDIPAEVHQVRRLPAGVSSKQEGGNLGGVSLNELERQAIIDTLAKTGNNREKAAQILGIGERTLYRKIKEYNI